MRKSLITRIPENAPLRDQAWMDLDRIASVEVSSEEIDYPIESALLLEGKRGWRAADSGTQTIRLLFDEPQKVRRILLVFEDTETAGHKSSSFGGHPISGILLARSSASNGILARRTQWGRQKTTWLNSRKSRYSN